MHLVAKELTLIVRNFVIGTYPILLDKQLNVHAYTVQRTPYPPEIEICEKRSHDVSFSLASTTSYFNWIDFYYAHVCVCVCVFASSCSRYLSIGQIVDRRPKMDSRKKWHKMDMAMHRYNQQHRISCSSTAIIKMELVTFP